MSFTLATAISRIDNLQQPIWTAGATASQKLQACNQALDKMWTLGGWDGLLQEVTGLTSVSGILVLPSQYKILTGLRVCGNNGQLANGYGYGGSPRVSIKSQQWKFSPNANGTDWGCYCGPPWIAFDLGDFTSVGTGLIVFDTGLNENVEITSIDGILTVEVAPEGSTPSSGITIQDQGNGQFYNIGSDNGIIGLYTATPTSSGSNRKYQIPGPFSITNNLIFSGMAKLRYIYASDTNTVVEPDCFEALMMAIRAIHWYDTGDTKRAEEEFNTAVKLVNADLGQVQQDADMGRVTTEFEFSGGSILNIY